jgi:hypothetical protein
MKMNCVTGWRTKTTEKEIIFQKTAIVRMLPVLLVANESTT